MERAAVLDRKARMGFSLRYRQRRRESQRENRARLEREADGAEPVAIVIVMAGLARRVVGLIRRVADIAIEARVEDTAPRRRGGKRDLDAEQQRDRRLDNERDEAEPAGNPAALPPSCHRRSLPPKGGVKATVEGGPGTDKAAAGAGWLRQRLLSSPRSLREEAHGIPNPWPQRPAGLVALPWYDEFRRRYRCGDGRRHHRPGARSGGQLPRHRRPVQWRALGRGDR